MLWLKQIKKIWPCSNNIAGQERNTLIAFSDNYGYLTPHQNLMSGRFLKVNCHVESKTIAVKFLYSCYTKNLLDWLVL